MCEAISVIGVGASGRRQAASLKSSLICGAIEYIDADDASIRGSVRAAKCDIVCVAADISESLDELLEAADAARDKGVVSIACVAIPNGDGTAAMDAVASRFDAYFVCKDASTDEDATRPLRWLADMVSDVGMIKIDPHDIRAIFRGAGECSLGVGESAAGDASEAVRNALDDAGVSSRDDVSRAMMMIYGGASVSMESLLTISGALNDAVSDDALVIWGHIVDEKLGDMIRVVVMVSPDSVAIPLPQMKISLD